MDQTKFSHPDKEDLIVSFFPADPRSAGRSEARWIISTTEGDPSPVQQKKSISVHDNQFDCNCACK